MRRRRDQVVVAVTAGAPLAACRGEQSPGFVEPEGLWTQTTQLRGHRDAVDPEPGPGPRFPVIYVLSDRVSFPLHQSNSRCYIKPMADHRDLLRHSLEVEMMLMRTDPFRDLDRWTQQVVGTAARPAVMPMDAWRDGDRFIVEFDLPGIAADSLGLDVERNVLTVHAERPDSIRTGKWSPRNAREECSAARSSWATPSTPTRSRRAITTGCCA